MICYCQLTNYYLFPKVRKREGSHIVRAKELIRTVYSGNKVLEECRREWFDSLGKSLLLYI